MLAKPKIKNQSGFSFTLEETLNQKHPLYILSHRVDWELFDREFNPLYCEEKVDFALAYQSLEEFNELNRLLDKIREKKAK